MLPLLKLAADGQEYYLRDIIEKLADEFSLTEEERKELLPSGQQSVFANRVWWARTYLKQAGLLEVTKRGYIKITERGKQVLSQNPKHINIKFLEQFPEFLEFRQRRMNKKEEKPKDEALSLETPDEILEYAYQKIRDELAKEILNEIKNCSPSFFEKLVVDLLVKMGYGGTRKDAAAKVTGKPKDGGVDGTIKEDPLGLDEIYIQAKRWEGVVGRPEIQQFAGMLDGKKTKKGIFITTSYFSKEAKEFANNISSDKTIILIDGETLAQLMIDYNIGVVPVRKYEIKKIDRDYFSEE
jgi:restriction system protein